MTRDNSNETGSSIASRRTFLKVAGAGAVVGSFANFSIAQGETIRLGGEVQGWQGRAPSSIEGTVNPTLNLEAGTEYTVVWENLDGQPHDFDIRNESGESVVDSDIISEQGATTEVTFTASEEMATYVCSVHPTSMRGDIQLGQAQGTTTAEEDQQLLPEGPTVGLQAVASGPLASPVSLEYAEEDRDRRFIVDQVGQIYVHGPDGLQDEPFLDLTDRMVEVGSATDSGFDERGLLDMAFHPNFAENGRFYVRYSAPPGEETPTDYDHTAVLSEFQTAEDMETANPDSERVLLEVPEPQFNHNGGALTFGPDGYLYASLGDGGDADDTGLGHVQDWYDENDGGNGQDVEENLLGSILRIDVDNEGENTPYAIPDDNPLVDGPGLPEHYAWGFRNPWQMSFNDGDLFVADVGQNLWEEVDIVEAGGNYGWNIKEGTHCFSTNNPGQSPSQCPNTAPSQPPYNGQELIDPVIEYPHTVDGQTLGISVTGGYVYQGDAIPELQGAYVFGDWSRSFTEPLGSLFTARPPEDGTTTPGGTTTTGGGTDATATTEGGDMATGTETEMGTETGTEMAYRQETGTTEPGTKAATEAGTGTETGTATGTEATTTATQDGQIGGPNLWDMESIVVEGSPTGEISRFVLAFGRDADGELYVLTNAAYTTGSTGVVFKIVPPGEGEEIQPATPIPTATPGETTTGEAGETATEAEKVETTTGGGTTEEGTEAGNETTGGGTTESGG